MRSRLCSRGVRGVFILTSNINGFFQGFSIKFCGHMDDISFQFAGRARGDGVSPTITRAANSPNGGAQGVLLSGGSDAMFANRVCFCVVSLYSISFATTGEFSASHRLLANDVNRGGVSNVQVGVDFFLVQDGEMFRSIFYDSLRKVPSSRVVDKGSRSSSGGYTIDAISIVHSNRETMRGGFCFYGQSISRLLYGVDGTYHANDIEAKEASRVQPRGVGGTSGERFG